MKREKTEEKNIYIGPGQVRYYRRGDFERSLGTTSQREAIKRKKALEAKMDAFGQQAFKLAVNDVIKEFLDERWREAQSGQIRMSTYLETEDMFRLHLLNFFGSKRFVDIDEPLWDEYVNSKGDMDLSNHRKVMSFFLTWSKRKRYYRYIPDLKIPTPKRRHKKILSPEVCASLIEASHGSLRLFLMMHLFMGMRRSEIMKLHWRRVDLASGFLTLFAEDTKTNLMRQVTINKNVLEILRYRLKTARPPKQWVFPNLLDESRHADVRGLKTAWYTCLKRCGYLDADFTWGDLRATHQYYTHKRIDFTDTQREKFSGSSVVVQRRHYVSFEAEDVRGLESAVQFKGLDQLMEKVLRDETHGEITGKTKARKVKNEGISK